MDDGYWESLLRDVENEAGHELSVAGKEGEVATTPDGPVVRRGHAGEGVPGAMAGTRSGVGVSDQEDDWERAQALLVSGLPFCVQVSGFNRGGLLAEFGRIQGFLPASHLLAPPAFEAPGHRIGALATRVGESLTVRVIEIERDRQRLILSERCGQTDGAVVSLLHSLRAGLTCRGVVTNICAFGVFVDLGGFEGLIHISELSWRRVNTPNEVVMPGDQVEVMVLDVNQTAQKVALSLKRLRPDPWLGADSRYRRGQVLDAVITNVVAFGAFAKLEEGLEGLIHISELAEGSFMHPRNIVNEGDHVRARVLHVDGANHRLALTMRNSGASDGDRSGRDNRAGSEVGFSES